MIRPIVLMGAIALLAGCSTDPSSERVVGQILVDSTMGPFLKTIIAPDTVDPDTSLTITINTFGSSSCIQPDGVDLTTGATLVRVVPYDLMSSGRFAGCTADFASRPHPVELAFPSSGALVIRAVGRVGNATDSIEHTVHIKP